MQGYDSVCINADIELGGTDQTFNNLVGRDLQEKAGVAPQVVITMPILRGLDGTEKMSKSKGNYIAINDTPAEMFGKVMSIPDELTEHYFTLLTSVSTEEISKLCDINQSHPRDTKVTLAKLVIEQFHSKNDADNAEAEFNRVFRESGTPDDIPEITLSAEQMNIIEMVISSGLVDSKGEAKRLIKQNAVSINGEKISEIGAEIMVTSGMILKVGKRRFCKILV